MTTPDEESQTARLLEAGQYASAIQVLRPLAQAGSAYALLCLGWIYDSGVAGERDEATAEYHYRKAAELGVASGYFELARFLYDQGKLGEARGLFAEGGQ